MKKRTLVLAALAPLVAAGAANAAMDEMAPPEMRVWTATLSEPSEAAPEVTLQITASQSTTGSNGMVIERVALVSTEMSEDDEGNLMETMRSVACQGPFVIEGRSFKVEAAPMEEGAPMAEAAPMEEGALMAEAAPMEEAGEAEAEPCRISLSGNVSNTYRPWHSWDMEGSVTMGEATAEFEIASPTATMILEPEPEEEMSEETAEESS